MRTIAWRPLCGALLLALVVGCGDDEGGGNTPPAAPDTVVGKMLFQARIPTVVNNQISLGQLQNLPAVGLEIYVADAGGNILGHSPITNEDGSFSVKLSRNYQPNSDLLFTAALYAPVVGGKEQLMLAVLQPKQGGAPKANMSLDPWVWSMQLTNNNVGTVTISEAQGSGAVFIYMINLAAMSEVVGALPGSGHKVEPLAVIWAPGITWSCGACYGKAPQKISTGGALTQSIFISGASNESSAWGYSVLLHEFGHYVAANYSRDDSPGGAHYFGQLIAPAFAWSEGWATFLSAAVMSIWTEQPFPLYWDIQQGSSFWINLATATHFKGTLKAPNPSGSMGQSLDEYFVSTMLWHLWDGKDVAEPAGDDDGTALGSEAVLSAIMSSRFTQYDRGGQGADFVDFVDAAVCQQSGITAAVTKTVTQYLGFPYDGKPGCN